MAHLTAAELAEHLGTSKAAARIRAAACEVFAARGYGVATTREIAASLDLSPGAVYPHYKTKESLLFAIALEGHWGVLTAVTSADDPELPPADRLSAVMGAFVLWHAERTAISSVIQHELRSLEPEHLAMIVDIRRSTTAAFDAVLRAGVDDGTFGIDDVPTATLALTSLGIDVSRWFPSRRISDPHELSRRYSDIALRIAGASRP
ncbi:TetR family transcriptional regulator [Gordonia spumicola]|uniref:TetR family transcriptional regulator n=1 Tax=Gordonia spumicola TaxID=589161 RepID=A0A7I9VCQ6_9ACTN|nr:TetR/AcrR family transcriptional regulator [Gordonia spumicola]GEE02931.1 TetR family transcriptional regulator [Gordonia spumicola]